MELVDDKEKEQADKTEEETNVVKPSQINPANVVKNLAAQYQVRGRGLSGISNFLGKLTLRLLKAPRSA